MIFLFEDSKHAHPVGRVVPRVAAPVWADVVAIVLLAVVAVLIFHGVGEMRQSLTALNEASVTLDPWRLPEYALLTTLRMFAALAASLIFTFTVATLAAKNRKAELLLIPALDILQSVPILGFLTFTVTFFMGLFPGRQLGVECAAIFAIFTSQAWNMAFSFYQSLRTIPNDLDEVSRQFGFSPWRRFVRLELPFATPSLVWNTMMSMSGGWFFVVASEAITVGDTTVKLPGIGSWLAQAIAQENFGAVAWAVFAMAVVIVLYDQLVFRPVVAWADKFRFEQTASHERPRSWVYNLVRRTKLLPSIFTFLALPARAFAVLDWSSATPRPTAKRSARAKRIADRIWKGVAIAACLGACLLVGRFIAVSLSVADVLAALGLGLATLARVAVLIVIASLIWVPIGVWIGLRPVWSERLQPIAQFLAAFPANVLFPFAVIAIISLNLNPNIWLSPLIILGTQWYILFNVIAGASALPNDLKETARMFGMRGWQRWRQFILPGIFPYYVTGALTASGGSWNASIVAEAVSWGDKHLEAAGLGSFIANATEAGDLPRVALGIAVMSVFVVAFNRILWRPLYGFAERRLRLD